MTGLLTQTQQAITSAPLDPEKMTALIQQINDMYSSTFDHYLSLAGIGIAILTAIVASILVVQSFLSNKNISKTKKLAKKLEHELKGIQNLLDEQRLLIQKQNNFNLIKLESILNAVEMSCSSGNFRYAFQNNSHIAKCVIEAICNKKNNEFTILASENIEFNQKVSSFLLESLSMIDKLLNSNWKAKELFGDEGLLYKQNHILKDTIKYIQENLTSGSAHYEEINNFVKKINLSLSANEKN